MPLLADVYTDVKLYMGIDPEKNFDSNIFKIITIPSSRQQSMVYRNLYIFFHNIIML